MRMAGRLSLESKRDVDRVLRIRDSVAGNVDKYEKKLNAPMESVDRLPARTFRDANGVLRRNDGTWRFAPETAPHHKRPKRIPWEKKP